MIFLHHLTKKNVPRKKREKKVLKRQILSGSFGVIDNFETCFGIPVGQIWMTHREGSQMNKKCQLSKDI